MQQQQSLEQVLALYANGLNNIQRCVIADLFAMPEFRALPKEWVPSDAGHRFDYNVELPIAIEYIGARYPADGKADPSVTFDPEKKVCDVLKHALGDDSAHLVLLVRVSDSEEGELVLYYKAVAH